MRDENPVALTELAFFPVTGFFFLASFIFQLTLFAAKAAPTILPFTVGAALAANLSTWQLSESVNYFNIYMKDALFLSFFIQKKTQGNR